MQKSNEFDVKSSLSVLFMAIVLMVACLFFSGCSNGATDAEQKTKEVPAKTEEASKSTESNEQKKEESAQAPNSEELVFTDQAGNEVKIKAPVERIVCMQHHSLDILAQLGAQDKVVATEKNWEQDLGSYIKDVFPGVEKLPTPGDLKELNVEEIVALKPDVVIVASQANPEKCQKLRDLGIPVCTVSLRSEGKQAEAQNPRLSNADKAYTDGLEWSIKTLGKLVGKEDRANKIWDFCTESRDYVSKQIELDKEVKDESQLVKAFVANPGDKTYGTDKYVGCMLLRAGGINVAAKDIQGFKPYTFEMVANWDPDVIIVQDRYKDLYDQIKSDPKWAELRAVKEDKVILAPYWTKPWGNPDSDSIALGEPWLAHQFYPEKVSADYVQQRAENFYKEFYGVEFKDQIK